MPHPPKEREEVQSLNDKVAALNRFVSRVTDKCLPFFCTLKKSFEWTAECQQAFEDLKTYLSSPPLLSPLRPREKLFLYLAISPVAVNAALLREEDKAIELSEFDIQYRPCTAIKGQVVADFIAKFTNGEDKGADERLQWSIHIDRSFDKQADGAGIVLLSPEGDKIECMVHLDFPTTNNEAEYEALVAGLNLAKVVINQVNGDYECKGKRMKKYLEQVRRRVDDLHAKIVQIPRGKNEQVDRLAKAASAEHMIVLDNEIGSENDWTTPLVSYLKNGVLLDRKEAIRKLKVQAARFVLIKDDLYKRGFSRPYLRCLGLEEADCVMKEVHEGICGNHSGSRSLVHKLIRVGYYWSTTQKDAQTYVKAYDKCQRFNNIIKQSSEELTPMTTPWSLAQWGLDIMGSFPIVVQ
ncbi:uncharacterized protein LOC126690175 [Quercus robur]|uniref:uncharacterized protein LOC126690175 n=1 Tax=Quercus robur TaxID=38942 RepID=UPI002161D05F|nr:uncharacterized protein LOC126690175 [Quercus robur]